MKSFKKDFYKMFNNVNNKKINLIIINKWFIMNKYIKIKLDQTFLKEMKKLASLNRNIIKQTLILTKIKLLWIKNNQVIILVYKNIYKVKY